jgi:hypothetical protein
MKLIKKLIVPARNQCRPVDKQLIKSSQILLFYDTAGDGFSTIA